MASQPKGLPTTIQRGIVNFPGTTPDSQQAAEDLLARDRAEHHCFYGRVGFHNHLSHHLLAAYDFGASPTLLQALYDSEKKHQDGIYTVDTEKHVEERQDVTITPQDWKEFLQQRKFYSNYLDFFTEEIATRGITKTLETYLFSPDANDETAKMIPRLVGGALHPLIQIGYGIEFKSDAMVAQALAQAAVTSDFYPAVFDLHQTSSPSSEEIPLLSVFKAAYDSDIMTPVLPYNPDALLSKRLEEALGGDSARPAEIRRLTALWGVPDVPDEKDVERRLKELFFVATLLFAGTGREGHKPRLDFFLMHVLNSTLFLPSLLPAIVRPESRAMLLRAFLSTTLSYLTIRGRPHINAPLIMSYTATPHPPSSHAAIVEASSDAIGDPTTQAYQNPWLAIVADVLHAPDSHTIKATRALFYAASKYGSIPAGKVPGAVGKDGKEVLPGIAQVDGTVFIRAAGALMDTLGWVTHGEKAGSWDRSGLGWDDAWKSEPST